ncbi:CHAP domain-containing protein [Treponema phagedenis]|uniref:CHAP domain-containing protein n=1 Tax=Treponema phagedenis TaxID=162 RepID=UPI0011E740B4|nr:CHAP domain-containing protein [Treponema phagedenis]QEJ95318.1 CHAP domain-containing protein [Treponema phagedenis]QEK01172.1 CHAP domain-containing protein [Treponema phagedenis]QEK02783.1 CHAP domain-containing protein [Treponema phagedenis]QEK08413.1 CHAP domain-containing protein [Treponema phagedenis]
MSLDEFVKKYLGKKVDYDGHYGAQCVDLFRQYCKDVLKIPHTGGVIGASELYTKYEKLPLEMKYFERIPRTKGKPQAGDVAVFMPTKGNKYGHVAIVISADKETLTVFEQDGFAQTGTYIVTRSYTYILGFLRKKEGIG